MATESASQVGRADQDLVAALRRVYGKNPIQRDVFGRRMALPSEVAQALTTSRVNAAASGQGEDTLRIKRPPFQQSTVESEKL